jgi:murein DD-endopeptidase MepM/ murein hydrolase activator NlpD
MNPLLAALALFGTLLAAPTGAPTADGGVVPVVPASPVVTGGAVWPLDPKPVVVSGFDPPASPWGPGHRGVDLLGRAGQPVRAALAGRVTFAGTLAGRGVVVVDHGATRTTYEPVAPTVTVGATVPTGGTLGALQAGASHCRPRACLHWGLLRGEEYLDPLSLLGRGPVRLLPFLTPGGGPAGRPSAASRR